MTGWYRRQIQQSIKREEQKFVESMRSGEKVVWKVPPGSPCENCLMRLGSSSCVNKCPYYPELIRMRDRGELRKVNKK